RSPEAAERLRRHPPDVLLTTGPQQFHQPAVAAAARALGIRALALIPAWDNLTTKNRMVFKYDGYAVWSEQMRRDLLHYYPHSRSVPSMWWVRPSLTCSTNPVSPGHARSSVAAPAYRLTSPLS